MFHNKIGMQETESVGNKKTVLLSLTHLVHKDMYHGEGRLTKF
jgi:hypothetical protein